MIKRTFRGLLQLLGGLIAGLAIMVALAIWQFSTGPVSLAFLTPHIEKALSKNFKGFDVRLDDTIITWAGWERTLDFRIINARVVRDDGEIIARAPQMALSLSVSAMMRGMLAPKSIELFSPKLALVHRKEGGFEVSFNEGGGASSNLTEQLFDEFLSTPDLCRESGYLDKISIIDADLIIEDKGLGMTWSSPLTQVKFWRVSDGIKGNVSLEPEVEGQKSKILIAGDYFTKARRFDLQFNFSDISPAVFSKIVPGLEPLSAFDLPLEGAVSISAKAGGVVENANFDFTSGEGRLQLPPPLNQNLHVKNLHLSGNFSGAGELLLIDELLLELANESSLTLPAPYNYKITMKSILTHGNYNGLTKTLNIEDLSIDLGPDGALFLPSPTNHSIPMKSARIKARYFFDAQRLELTSLHAGLHGPSADLSATIDGIGGNMEIKAKGVLHNMPVNDFSRYWPRAWGSAAQAWSVESLSDGMVDEARISVHMRSGAAGDIKIVSLTGGMDLKDITVNYLTPMPKVTKTSGTVKFNQDRFDIYLSHGLTGDLKISEGKIFITDLQKKDQYIDIKLSIEGPVKTALELIDSKPLGFAREIGLDPKNLSGHASIDLGLFFILERAVTRKQIKISVAAQSHNVTIINALHGKTVTSDELNIIVDNNGMDLGGKIILGNIPADMTWRESFALKPKFRSRYNFTNVSLDAENIASIGIDISALPKELFKGSMATEARITRYDDKPTRMEFKSDLTNVDMNFPMLGWSKKAGVGGTAITEINVMENHMVSVPYFNIATGDLLLKGSINYAKQSGNLERIKLDEIAYGRTRIRGSVTPEKDGSWIVALRGKSLDLEPVLSEIFKDKQAAKENTGLRFTISADLDRVWLNEKDSLQRVSGVMSREGEMWTQMKFDSLISANKKLKVVIKPGNNSNRSLSIMADDAGAVFRTFGFYDNMIGGTFKLTGEFDDISVGSPLKGKLLVSDYRLIKSPALIQMLSILALTGIIEAMQQEGLYFDTLSVPFTLEDGVLEMTNAKASGITLGYTASGKIDTQEKRVNLKGTVVPAYAVNNFLGIFDKIPLFKEIFTGEEEGSGVFAANYKMYGSIDEPEVSVSPLSVFAPGIFRDIYGAIEDTVLGDPTAKSREEDRKKFEKKYPVIEDEAPVVIEEDFQTID